MQSFGSVLGEKKCCQGFLINYLSKISIFSCFTHETFLCEMASSKNKLYIYSTYRTRAIITRGLYIFYPIFHCGLYCRAVSITDNLCTKQGNSSIFEPKFRGL